MKLTKEQIRKENKKADVFYNEKLGLIEIQYNSKTIIAKVTNIDRDTDRQASKDMALGSGFKKVRCRK